MNEQITSLIEQLAQKLGTSVEYLWGVLIKQAEVEVITFFIALTLSAIAATSAIFMLKHSQKYWNYENAPLSAWVCLIGGIIVAICALIGFVGLILSIPDLISAIKNPEYWALKEVLSTIK